MPTPQTAVPTPRDGTAPAAEFPHAAAGAPPTCRWCGDLGLVQVAELIGDRAIWAAGLLVPCVCVEAGRAA